MIIKVAGIEPSVKNNQDLQNARPSGDVSFVPEPDNKFDSGAILIVWEGHKLGYVPAACNKNWKHTKGKIAEYSYSEGEGKNKKFNNEHNGILGSVKVEVDETIEIIDCDGETVEYNDTTHTYIDNGGVLLSASKLKNFLPTDLTGFTKYAVQFDSFEDQQESLNKAADEGTKVHDICENALRGKEVDHPVNNFIEKFSPNLIAAEEVVYDPISRIVGRFDAFVNIAGKKILIDWKNGKMNPDYWVQTGFYGKMKDADDVWIVSFSTKNKCGYAVSKMSNMKGARGTIEYWYILGTMFAKTYYYIQNGN